MNHLLCSKGLESARYAWGNSAQSLQCVVAHSRPNCIMTRSEAKLWHMCRNATVYRNARHQSNEDARKLTAADTPGGYQSIKVCATLNDDATCDLVKYM